MSDLKKDAITVLTAIELGQRLDGMGQARFAARWSAGKLALERIVRLAARVGELETDLEMTQVLLRRRDELIDRLKLAELPPPPETNDGA